MKKGTLFIMFFLVLLMFMYCCFIDSSKFRADWSKGTNPLRFYDGLSDTPKKNWQGFIDHRYIETDENGLVIEIDWFKSQLNQQQKLLYEEIEANIDLNKIYEQQKFNKNNCNLDDLFLIFECLMRSRADLEFLIRNHSWALGEDETFFYFKVKESEADKKLEEFKLVKKEINAIVNSLDTKQTVVEVIRDIHDLLIERMMYDTDLTNRNKFNAYGALIDGMAVCQGYSSAMKWILDEIKVPCIQVFGLADGGRHAWNLVCINQVWYGIDMTWDDPINGSLRYDYFMNNERMKKSHVPQDAVFILPQL